MPLEKSMTNYRVVIEKLVRETYLVEADNESVAMEIAKDIGVSPVITDDTEVIEVSAEEIA